MPRTDAGGRNRRDQWEPQLTKEPEDPPQMNQHEDPPQTNRLENRQAEQRFPEPPPMQKPEDPPLTNQLEGPQPKTGRRLLGGGTWP